MVVQVPASGTLQASYDAFCSSGQTRWFSDFFDISGWRHISVSFQFRTNQGRQLAIDPQFISFRNFATDQPVLQTRESFFTEIRGAEALIDTGCVPQSHTPLYFSVYLRR